MWLPSLARQKVVKYLIDNSPTPVKSTSNGSDIIEAVHGENIDPNDLLLKYSRNDEERKAKAKDVPGQFWGGRQSELSSFSLGHLHPLCSLNTTFSYCLCVSL